MQGSRLCRPPADRPGPRPGTSAYTSTMSRFGITIVLVLAMLWQTVAMARPGSTVSPAADLAHAALHWQDEGHHHHDNGSYHVDDSAESVQHLIAEHGSVSIAVLPAAPPSPPPLGTAPHGVLAEDPGPHPFLDGALRPPRLTA